MRTLAVVTMIGLMMLPAHSEDTPQQSAEKRQKEELERAYQRALKNTRSDAPADKPDPWGSVRSAPVNAKQNAR